MSEEQPPVLRLMDQRIAEFRRLRVWLSLLLASNLAVAFVTAWMTWR